MTENVENVENKIISVIDKKVISAFPSLIFKGRLNDLSLCDEVEKVLYSLRDRKEGSFEAGNFVTNDNLQELPELANLSRVIIDESEEVLDFFGVIRDGHYISNMWGNITDPNHRHMIHIHPNCLYSGIFYIKTPKDCGPTVFSDPRPGARILEPNYTQLNETNAGVFMNMAEKGGFLMWPSWLHHGVERGFCNVDEDRIVVAFNIMIHGTINTKTASLVL